MVVMRASHYAAFAILSVAVAACTTTEIIRQDPSGKPSPTSSENGDSPSGPGSTTSGSRIKAKILTAEDGTKTPLGFRDTARNEDCSFQMVDGRFRCLPSGASVRDDWFSDSTCKKRLAMTSKGCDAPTVALAQTTYCAPTGYQSTSVYALGPRYTGASVYTTSGGSCTAQPATSYTANWDLYQLGDEIALDQFVAADAKAE